MKSLLLLASLCSGQTLPDDLKDPDQSAVVEYLHQEIRKLKAETGVSADGDNTWTGTNDWDGASTFDGVVRMSSGATVTFAAGLNFTSTQGSFNPTSSVTGSTLTFTTSGTTVTCSVTGNFRINNTGAAIMTIMVDGASAGGSSTVGLWVCGAAAIICPLGGSHELQVTAGQHSYHLALMQTGGGTASFMDSANGAGKFTCREVPSK